MNNKRFNFDLLLENTIGVFFAVIVLLGLAFIVTWSSYNRSKIDLTKDVEEKIQTLKANSIDESEIERLYQKKREAIKAKIESEREERQKFEREKKKIEIERKRLKNLERKKKVANENEKKRISLEKKYLEKQKKIAEISKRKAEEALKKAIKRKKQADLAIKRAKEEQKKQAEAKRKAEMDRKEAERKRIAAELASHKEERAKQEALSRYGEAISAKVKGLWSIPAKLPNGLSAILQIKISVYGQVKSIRVAESSGNIAFDNSTIQAVKQSSPLPVPKKKSWAKEFSTINMKFP